MQITHFAIRRPVTTTMLNLAIVVLGIFSYGYLGVDLFPNVEFPFVTVQTTLKGASPEEIETSVTKPIEELIATTAIITTASAIPPVRMESPAATPSKATGMEFN